MAEQRRGAGVLDLLHQGAAAVEELDRGLPLGVADDAEDHRRVGPLLAELVLELPLHFFQLVLRHHELGVGDQEAAPLGAVGAVDREAVLQELEHRKAVVVDPVVRLVGDDVELIGQLVVTVDGDAGDLLHLVDPDHGFPFLFFQG